MQERLFTVHQVADLLGSRPREVLQWIRRDWIAPQRLPDGSLRISERALLQFLKDRGIDLKELLVSAGPSDDALPAAQGLDRAPEPAPLAEPFDLPQLTPLPTPAADSPPRLAADRQPEQDRAIREILTGDRDAPPADVDDAPSIAGALHGPAEPRPDTPPTDDDEPARPLHVDPTQTPASTPNEEAVPPAASEPPPAEPMPSAPAMEAPSDGESDADVASQIAAAILEDAVALSASHVHIEQRPDGPALLLRIDGQLRDKPNFGRRLPEGLGPAISGRLLAWAGADEDLRRPTTGRFTRCVAGRDVAFDLSALPTAAGPRLVIALKDCLAEPPDLTAIALPEDALQRLERILASPGGGLVLVAGAGGEAPAAVLRLLTGSLCRLGRCVVTAESASGPDVAGACRSAVDPFDGYRFAHAARALMAQDADAIVIQQLRDPTAATAALEAALAGRVVLGGIRAAGAAEALAILAEMDLEPWPLAAALEAIVSVRTVRRLCEYCRKASETPEQLPQALGLSRGDLGRDLFQPTGCERCGRTGYSGTIQLTSLTIPDPELARLIRTRAGAEALGLAFRDDRSLGLYELVARQLRAGATSLEEIARLF